MGSPKWNILTISIYVYNRFIYPVLLKYGIIEYVHLSQHYITLVFSKLLPGAFLKFSPTAALVMVGKFILLLALLIFIRGGVPRYRYDFLTKIGWIKFLSLVLLVFLSSLLLTLVF